MTQKNGPTEKHKAGIQAAIHAFYHAEADSGEEEMENVIKAYLSASGMALVPMEPTMEMLKAADNVSMSDEDMLVGPYEFDKAVYKVYLKTAINPFESKP